MTESRNPSTVRKSEGTNWVERRSSGGARGSNTADGGGRMMLRIPNILTLISQAKRMSVVTRTGHPRVAAYLPMLFRMARLDRLAEMANQAIERFVLGHGNRARSRKLDCQFVDDRRRPTPHDQDAVGEERRFTDAVGDENHGFPIGLPNALEFDRHFVARDCIQRAEWLVHHPDTGA